MNGQTTPPVTPPVTPVTPAPAPVEKPKGPVFITAPLDITRNGVTLKIVNAVKEKGTANGQSFATIDPDTDPAQLFTFLGAKTVTDIVTTDVRKSCQIFSAASTTHKKGPSGVEDPMLDTFDINKFKKFVDSWESSQESTRSLQAKLQALSEEFTNDNSDMSTPEGLAAIMDIKNRMQAITSTLVARKLAAAEAASEDESTAATPAK